jgi:hypothetical protein
VQQTLSPVASRLRRQTTSLTNRVPCTAVASSLPCKVKILGHGKSTAGAPERRISAFGTILPKAVSPQTAPLKALTWRIGGQGSSMTRQADAPQLEHLSTVSNSLKAAPQAIETLTCDHRVGHRSVEAGRLIAGCAEMQRKMPCKSAAKRAVSNHLGNSTRIRLTVEPLG